MERFWRKIFADDGLVSNAGNPAVRVTALRSDGVWFYSLHNLCPPWADDKQDGVRRAVKYLATFLNCACVPNDICQEHKR